MASGRGMEGDFGKEQVCAGGFDPTQGETWLRQLHAERGEGLGARGGGGADSQPQPTAHRQLPHSQASRKRARSCLTFLSFFASASSCSDSSCSPNSTCTTHVPHCPPPLQFATLPLPS